MTSAPEFHNKAFIMSVPRANNARSLHPTAVEDLLDGKDWPGFGVTEGPNAEGVALGDGPPALVCQLYAARSAGHSVMGQDVLVGQGYVEFFGATVQRLARGEAVSMTVSLEHPEGRAPSQLSLQITMLDTDGGAGGQVATRDGPGAGRTLRVSVLVHGATNLDSGDGAPPAAFVAAKTMREAAARLPSRAATRAVPKSRDPIWDEVVSVEVAEHELDREKVLLAVVNHDTNKLMAKAAVPLKALEVGRHYGLGLDLGGGATLNVTVVIPQAPARELEFLKKHNDYVRVEGSITGISGKPARASSDRWRRCGRCRRTAKPRARRRLQEDRALRQGQRGIGERRREHVSAHSVGLQIRASCGASGLEPFGSPLWPRGTGGVVRLAVGDPDGRRDRSRARQLGGHDLPRGRACRGPRRGRAAHGAEHVPLICGGGPPPAAPIAARRLARFRSRRALGLGTRFFARARRRWRLVSTVAALRAWAARALGCSPRWPRT